MLNLDALKNAQKDLESRSSGGTYVKASKMPEEYDVRILPPNPNMNGIYYVEERGYWINNKRYASVATFGEDCPMADEIEQAILLNDPTVNELLESQKFSNRSVFLFSFIELEVQADDSLKPTGVKILQCGTQLVQAINKIATSRPYRNGTDNGIFDREKGYNIVLQKSGTGKETNYTAMGYNEQEEMPQEFYDKIPDLVKITRDKIGSEAYQRSVIRNYLFGEPIIEDGSSNDTTEVSPKAVAKPATKPSGRPTTTKPASSPTPTAPQGGNDILADLENM